MSEWPHFEATFPILASGAGAGQAREQQKLRPTVIPLPPPAPNPTLTAPSPLPENSMRRSQELPFPGRSGLGQQRQEPRAVARTRAGSSRVPWLRSAKPGSPLSNFGGSARTFLEQNLTDQEPGFAQGGKRFGGPAQDCVADASHWRRSAPPEAPGPAPRPGATGSGAAPTYFFLLHEPHKGCPLDLHRLALSVVEGQDEVEEVGFPQIGRRLLLKVSPGQTHPAVAKDAELDG